MEYQKRKDAVEAVFSVGNVRTLEYVIACLLDNLPEGTTQAEAIENRLDEWYAGVTSDGKPIVTWEEDPHYMAELYTYLVDTCIYGCGEIDSEMFYKKMSLPLKALLFISGALGALYIVMDLLFEFALETVENGVKKLLEIS